MAYKMAGMHASSVPSVTSQRAQAGFSFSYGFNDREAIFPPKGCKPGDSQEVVSTPAEIRPLKCKNHDNKILAGERNAAMARYIKKYASTIQNGFIKGGFLTNG